MTLPTLTDLKNWSHSLAAIIGALMAAVGAVQLGLAQYDPSVSTKYAPQLIAFGGILAMISKAIDGINNAWSPGAAASPAAPVQVPRV